MQYCIPGKKVPGITVDGKAAPGMLLSATHSGAGFQNELRAAAAKAANQRRCSTDANMDVAVSFDKKRRSREGDGTLEKRKSKDGSNTLEKKSRLKDGDTLEKKRRSRDGGDTLEKRKSGKIWFGVSLLTPLYITDMAW